MNTDPKQNDTDTPARDKSPFAKAFKTLGKQIKGLFLRNLPWKLLAGFLALCLWAGLITQDPTLTRERIFSDVQVSLTGTDTLRRNGFILLSGAQEEPVNVRLRVDVPQREYNTVSASNYNPRIDLSRITETGNQALRISSTSSTTFGIVQEIFPDTLEVVVDEYYSNPRVPVSLERSGQFPKGFHGTAPSLDPSYVTVSGPKSIVSRISRVVVSFDVSSLRPQLGLVRTAVPMRFEDPNGDPVESSLIEVTNAGVLLRSIIVEQMLYPTKTLPVNSQVLTTGKPANGYEVKSITATPNILVAAGDELGLTALDSLFIDKGVDVSGKSESFTVEVTLRQPSELVYLSSKSVVLSIEIGPVISAREFKQLKFSFAGKPDGHTVISELKNVSATLTGPTLLLDTLKTADLSVYVDISGLEPGEHEVPLLLEVKNANPQSVTYDISPKLVKFRLESN